MNSGDAARDLDKALKELDLILSETAVDPKLAARMSRIRLLLTKARQLNTDGPSHTENIDHGPNSAPYMQSIQYGLPSDSAVQVAHLIVPLPLRQDRLSLQFLYADAFRSSIQDAVLRTINDGRINAGWMTEGGFSWERGDDWFEFSNPSRRGLPPQAIRIYQSGLVAHRDRWTDRRAYPVTRFEKFSAAAIAVAARIFDSFPDVFETVAISAHLSRIRDVKLGVPGIFGPDSTFDLLGAKLIADEIDVPKRPQIVRRDLLLRSANTEAEILRLALETHFERESSLG